MINAIDLNNEYENENIYINSFGNSLMILPNVKNINIFIGENNSGKSRFIRSLVKSKSLIYLSDQCKSNQDYLGYRIRLKQNFYELNSIDSEFTININHNDLSPCNLYAYYYEQFCYFEKKYKENSFQNINLKNRISSILSSLNSILTIYDNHQTSTKKSIKRIYIPVLRGIECYKEYFDKNASKTLNSISMDNEQRMAFDEYKLNAEKIYLNKISAVYGINEKDIFTGENLFNEIRDKLLGTEIERRFVQEFEKFISQCFFDNEPFSIIPRISEGYLNVKIGTSVDRALHDLGDGIKQIICILYKVFENRNNEAMICIEEPEINLHPGYQRKLIEILQMQEFSKILFFITTHSNHIIDSCFDYKNISIYKFININKNQNNTFQIINTSSNDIGILNQLGVNNSSVFMANCTIWVEGISDKLYLNKYLKTYIASKGLKDFKEGVDYSFVEYGGNNIVHWDFENDLSEDKVIASGITNRSFIVVDHDKGGKKKRKETLKKIFKNNFLELPVNEIENSIGNKLLEKYLSNYNSDYKSADRTNFDSVENRNIEFWPFIDSHYELKRKYTKPNSNEPRMNKGVFARQVCDLISDEGDLSRTAKLLANKIYTFISSVSNDIN